MFKIAKLLFTIFSNSKLTPILLLKILLSFKIIPYLLFSFSVLLIFRYCKRTNGEIEIFLILIFNLNSSSKRNDFISFSTTKSFNFSSKRFLLIFVLFIVKELKLEISKLLKLCLT